MLLAVHISDGILAPEWWLTGFVLAAGLLMLAAYRLREEEIAPIALLTAAVFISSSIHVRLGPTTVHLLMSGLVGVLLGRRAALAVFIGLVLQVLLLQHGGYYTLGVNTCVIALPALACGAVFHGLHGWSALRNGVGRSIVVGASGGLLFLSAAFCLLLARERVSAGWLESLSTDRYQQIVQQVFHPALLLAGLAVAGAAVWAERQLENAPEFPLGLLIGELAVLLTVGLNCFVLIVGAEENCEVPALILVLAHLPIAMIEGVILGVAVGFLAKVKPELLATPLLCPVLPEPEPEMQVASAER